KNVSTSYDIHIGRNILDRIALLIANNHLATNYCIVTDTTVSQLHILSLVEQMKFAGIETKTIEIPAGEKSKNINTVMDIANKLLQMGFDRSSMLIALGGGVVGDITGFVASIYMRGIPYIQIPTTLIAQTDSAIGGKTGVDLDSGKNLIGTFTQPKAVFIDLKFLDTLSQTDFNNGLSEVIKYGLIESAEFFLYLENNKDKILVRDALVIEKIVETSCNIKKEIVSFDEKESGLRRILNFGHTFAHGIEVASNYSITHGEAVAMGMVASARVSKKKHYLPENVCARLEKLLLSVGLPIKIPSTISANAIIAKMNTDKKKVGDKINFVLLKNIGIPFINDGISIDDLQAVLKGMKE
ncbi:MAG: 3-dehydroquinate synthase, partial [Deltaproteobacteria bacterium]